MVDRNGYVFMQTDPRRYPLWSRKDMDMGKGWISDIQRFSAHDGYGIRTTVFLKGCNIQCPWCHNPETIRLEPELKLIVDKCLNCGRCALVCKQNAITDPSHCIRCFACVEECYPEARVRVGQRYSPEELLREIIVDRPYFGADGGVTFSGGEPFLQAPFLQSITEMCEKEKINYAIETNLSLPWGTMRAVLLKAQLVMCDIKAWDDMLHAHLVGISNKDIILNLAKLCELGCPVIVRTPVLPGINDHEISKIAAFLAHLPNVLYYELLPYNPFAELKWRLLGRPYPLAGQAAPSRARMAALRDEAAAYGIMIRIMGD